MSNVARRLLAGVMSVALALTMCPALPAIANGGTTPQAYADEGIASQTTYELSAINEEKMWKVTRVQIEDNAGDQDWMTVDLTSAPKSYATSFAGSQDEAVASLSGKDSDSRWSDPAQVTYNPAVTYGTWDGGSASATTGYAHRMQIAVPEGKSRFTVDIVCLTNLEDGNFTARRVDVDLDAKTAICGSAKDTAEVAVTSQVPDVAANAVGSIAYTGYVAPYAAAQSQGSQGLSNDWMSILTLQLDGNGAYDRAYAVNYKTSKTGDYDATLGEALEPAEADYADIAEDGTLSLPVVNEYDTNPKTKQLNRDEIKVMMHVSKLAPYKEADTWVERDFKLNWSSRKTATLEISGKSLTPPVAKIAYDGAEYKLVKEDLESTFGMLSPIKDLSVTRSGGKIHVSYEPSNKTVYGRVYLDADIAIPGTWKEEKSFAIESGANISFDLDESYAGWAWPIAPTKHKDPTATTSAQYYMAIPALDKIPIVLEDGVYALPEMKAGPSEMFNHMEFDSKFLKVEGDTATVIFTEDGSTVSVGKYSRLALGKTSEIVPSAYCQDSDLVGEPTIIEGTLEEDTAPNARWHFEIPIANTEAADMVANGSKLYVTVWNNVGTPSNNNTPGWYKASKDIYLELGGIESEGYYKEAKAAADESIAAAQDALTAAETAASEAAEAAEDAAILKTAADEAAKTPGAAAVEAAKKAEEAAKVAAQKADAAKQAADAAKAAADKAFEAAVTEEQKSEAAAAATKAEDAVSAADTAKTAADNAVKTAGDLVTKAEQDKKAAEEAAKPTDTKPTGAAGTTAAAKPLAKGAKFTVSGTTYQVNGNGAVTLVSSKSTGKSLTVNTVKYKDITYKVTQVGKQAFKGAKKLKTVTLGANVNKLAAKAFAKSKVTTVVVKTSKLTSKASVKNCLKSSKVKTVKAKAAKAKTKKAFNKFSGKAKKCKVK